MKNWIVGVLVVVTLVMAQKVDYWNEFALTKFEAKWSEKHSEYLMIPTFPPQIKAMEGKEIQLQGYYIPFAPEGGNYIILSKYPMSQCFFCGGSGPESVLEVNFAGKQPTFQIDDLVTVKGKLKLNATDIDHVNFILTAAKEVK